MVKNSVVVAVELSFLSILALAFHCLLTSMLSTQHSTGNHTQSVATLAEAMRLILNNL